MKIDPLESLKNTLRKNFLKWFIDEVDGCVERKLREMDELIDWLERYPPWWLWHGFWLLRKGFDCWLLGRFMATVMLCYAACESMLATLFY